MRMIYYYLTFLVIAGCGHYNNLDYSDDFYFIYEDDVDKVNLKENTLTRRFIGKDSTINLKMTDSEKKKLFQIMKEYSIWTVNKADLKTRCQSFTLPSGNLRLEVSLEKGNRFEFKWTGNNCHESVDRLREVNAKIREIIYAKEEVKKLTGSNIVFM
jgi:hypothetical protein